MMDHTMDMFFEAVPADLLAIMEIGAVIVIAWFYIKAKIRNHQR